MCKILTVLFAISMMSLSGCGSKPSMLPTPSADLMAEPCKASDAGKNSDEDLQSDTENLECLADLRLKVYRFQSYVTEITKHTK